MNPINDQEFAGLQRFILHAAGITMADNKRVLLTSRLEKRLQHLQLQNYTQYLRLLRSGQHRDEEQMAIDLLTTNETYFFREPDHFEFLAQRAAEHHLSRQPMRVWSAACSSGEEVYSIAMVLAEQLDGGQVPWQLVGSDISSRVLRRAASGHYPMVRTDQMPKAYLQRYCRRGMGEQAGTLRIVKELRSRVEFRQVNLDRALPSLGLFDLIFLRNVMIYFSAETKREVVTRVLTARKPGGHLIVGHAETLHGISPDVETIMSSVYRKPSISPAT